jgi:hypothetical protein
MPPRILGRCALGAAVFLCVIVQATIVSPPASGSVIKHVDSRNASDGVDCSDGGSWRRGGLGDVFFEPHRPTPAAQRCTWVDMDFSRMRRYEVFGLALRFAQYAQVSSQRAAVALMRPIGLDLAGGVCGRPGNREIIFVRVFIDTRRAPDRWKVQLRGGASPWARDQRRNVSTIGLGRVVEGRTLHLRFSLHFQYRNGGATIWRNGARVYNNRNRPLGFHYNCAYRTSNADTTPNTNARDLSQAFLRMQHGIYRDATPAWTLTSTGFRFYCSQRTAC